MKIFGVAANYGRHNKSDDEALYDIEEPVVYIKADSALIKNGKPLFVPDHLGRVDYEAALVVRICRLGKAIPERFAHRYYDAVTVGVDFTARDLERRARLAGLPWALCRGFDGAAAIGTWMPVSAMPGGVQSLHFRLGVNGQTVQQASAGDMRRTVDQLVAYLSQFYTLKTGDLLFTGTPDGAGPVAIDDHMEGYLEGQKVLDFYCK